MSSVYLEKLKNLSKVLIEIFIKYNIIIKKLNGKLYGINRFSKKCKRIYL